MKLSNLERASEYDVHKWLSSNLQLTPYQESKLREKEIIRFAPFYFYKFRKQEKVSILWRLTLIVVPVYILLMWILLPLIWLVTGKWGYGRDFLDKFHYPWMHKLGL